MNILREKVRRHWNKYRKDDLSDVSEEEAQGLFDLLDKFIKLLPEGYVTNMDVEVFIFPKTEQEPLNLEMSWSHTSAVTNVGTALNPCYIPNLMQSKTQEVLITLYEDKKVELEVYSDELVRYTIDFMFGGDELPTAILYILNKEEKHYAQV